jgi:hypothetical protein
MSLLAADTNPKIEKMQIEIIRRMPAWKKVSVMDGLNETVRALAVAGIKQRQPEATPEQIRRALAEIILGPELARKVYDHAK